jgi:hypothetical protein
MQWLVLGVCAVATAPVAMASLMRAMDLSELTANADQIVVVDVLSTESAWDGGHRNIYSTVEIKVLESWKGSLGTRPCTRPWCSRIRCDETFPPTTLRASAISTPTSTTSAPRRPRMAVVALSSGAIAILPKRRCCWQQRLQCLPAYFSCADG